MAHFGDSGNAEPDMMTPERIAELRRWADNDMDMPAVDHWKVDEMLDEIERLREPFDIAARRAHASSLFSGGFGGADDPHAVAEYLIDMAQESVAEIERLQAENAELLAALKKAAADQCGCLGGSIDSYLRSDCLRPG